MDVMWIRIDAGLETNPKIQHIRRQANGDSIALFWVMLLCRAGRCNDGGRVWLTPAVPCSVDDLAGGTFKPKVVKDALALFQKLDMITMEDGFITVIGWADHQNTGGLEKLKQKTVKSDAERAADYRARKRERETAAEWEKVREHIDDNWMTSAKARGATAQIVLDYLVGNHIMKRCVSLYDAIYDGLARGFTPDGVVQAAACGDFAVFAATMETGEIDEKTS